MPIITLYGCKGGTGRTTCAATLALGLMAESLDVFIADTNKEDPEFMNWANHIASVAGPAWKGKVTEVENVLQLMDLKERLGNDPTKYGVIDTSRYSSDLRLMAFELSDLTVMPFGSYLDAAVGIERAAEEIPKGKQLVGLPFGPGQEISSLVAEWMPVLSETLPKDERLQLDSKLSSEFALKTLTTISPAIDGLEGTLRFLVRGISSQLMLQHLQSRQIEPAKALTTPNASLAATVREAVA